VAQRRQEQKEKEEQERAMREEMERLEQVSTFTNAFRLLQALTLHETMRTVSGQSERGQSVVQTERGWAERALHSVTQNKRIRLKKSTVTVATRGAISVPSAPIHRLSNMSCALLWHRVNESYHPVISEDDPAVMVLRISLGRAGTTGTCWETRAAGSCFVVFVCLYSSFIFTDRRKCALIMLLEGPRNRIIRRTFSLRLVNQHLDKKKRQSMSVSHLT